MSTEPLTLTIPDSLARELDSVGEGLLVDLLERGLREFKIDQALDRWDILWRGRTPGRCVTIRPGSGCSCTRYGTTFQRRDIG
jgi:hypothetical protein